MPPVTVPDDVRRLLMPLRAEPAASAVLSDFDGTLSAMVARPEDAVPLPGTVAALAAMAGRYRTVAVVSGRPVAFLQHHLGGAGIDLSGLYGLERAHGRGPVWVHPEAEDWRARVEAAASAAEGSCPAGATVERKGLSVTLHWRNAPEAERWALDLAADQVASSGLDVHLGRRSAELRPPVGADKGSEVRALTEGAATAVFLGDDVGDVPAFGALARAGLHGVALGVRSSEMAPEVLGAVQATVDGPAGALAVLEWLAAP